MSLKTHGGAWFSLVLTLGGIVVVACSSSTTTAVNCGDGSQVCGTSCTPIARDPENCGACGKKCATGEVCAQGVCAASCGGGTTKCGSSCVDTKSDGANCGACGTKCGATEVCNAGKCASACGAGSTACGSSCVNTQTDQVNCGACGTLCKGGEQCVAGTCNLSCQVGLSRCTVSSDGGVSDAASDVSISDAASDAAPPLGTTFCANLQTDNANCGACHNVCPGNLKCIAGACAVPPPLCSDAAKALCLAKGGQFAVRAYGTSFPNPPGGSIYCTTTTAGADCDTCGTYQQYVWKATAVDACNSGQAMTPGTIYGGHNPCSCGSPKYVCGTWAMNGCIPD